MPEHSPAARATPRGRRGNARSALWPALWLTVALVGAKAEHWGWPHPPAYPASHWLRDWAVSAYQDVLFAVAFGLASALALWCTLRWTRLRAWVYGAVVSAGALCALYAFIAVKVFDVLRSPLTYPLLYLAGGVRDMRSSVQGEGSLGAYATILGAPLAYVLAVGLSQRHVRLGSRALRRGLVLLSLLVPTYVIAAHVVAQGRWADRGDALIARSPHWALLASLVDLARGGGLPAIDSDFPEEYLSDFVPPASAQPAAAGPAPRNVIVLVLESTPARYTSLYGGPYRTTPMLEREAAHAAVFEAHYTPVGLTANVLVALHLSITPYMTWREYTVEYPDYPGTTLAQMLGARGYRTLFVHTGHLDYTNQDGFLASRGYDQVLDWDKLKAAGQQEVSSWGGDDRVLVDKLLAWIDGERERPFFTMAWTINSHHPYEPVPGQTIIDFFAGMPSLPLDDYDLGRYLNTIHETDRQVGRLFDGLRARGIADDTLVVVTGDHGQGFGWPHPNWGHGFRVYDENVRVPLLVWNPRLFPTARRSAQVTSHIDVSPTVAELLGLPPAQDWQGRSVFATDRPPRAYFYAANDLYLLGVREASWKYIYDATRAREELYDLANDPDEQSNLSGANPQRCRELRQRLAAWRTFAHNALLRAESGQPPGHKP